MGLKIYKNNLYLLSSLKQYKEYAETNYFKFNLKTAMEYSSILLLNYYAIPFNIFVNHINSYTFASLKCNLENEAIFFYNNIMANSLNKDCYREFSKQIDILSGNLNEYKNQDSYKEPKANLDASKFFDLLYNNMPNKNLSNRNTLLYEMMFIYKHGFAEDFLRYYEQYKDYICNTDQIHILASKVYIYFNQTDNVIKTLKKYIQYVSMNNEELPMSLFGFYSLYEYFNECLFKESALFN